MTSVKNDHSRARTVAPGMALLVSPPLARTKLSQQILNGLQWNSVLTLMFSRG